MTLKEAKKILEKEGFYFEKATRPCAISEAFTEYEDHSICKAMQVVSSAGYFVCMEKSCFDERKARLKKELEEHSNAPVSGKEKEKKGNPALEEAASQFNDALLDEQAKKIKRFGKEISRLNKIIHKKNEELRLTKIREKNLAELGLKYVGENEKLKKKLADKIVDKIDAQALKSAESALAYKEKVIAEKDEVIDKLTKENNDYKKVVEEFRNKIADMTIGKIEIQNIRLKEKDDVIADLGKELAATKKELEEKTKLVEEVRKYSKEYREYGIEAVKMIRKMANVIVYEKKVSSKEFEEYRRWANGYRFNPQLYDFIEEEEKRFSPAKDTHPTEDNPEEVELDEILECVRKALEKGHTVSIDYDKAEEGGDQSATIVQCDNGIILSKEEAEIIERCTKNGTELHYSEKDGLTYTNVFGKEMPIRCLRGIFHVFTDEEIENMKK